MKLIFDSKNKTEHALGKCHGVVFERVTVKNIKVSDIALDLEYPIIFDDSVEPVAAVKHILLHKDPVTSKPGDETYELKVNGLPQRTEIPDAIEAPVLRCVTTTPFYFTLEISLL